MKQVLYVIATRGRKGKEIYLAVDEDRSNNSDKIYFKWTEKIDEAYADFNGYNVEQLAKDYFKNFTKWYVTCYHATFE